MIGIAIITASLVILLSAFNGIEKMIEKLYSDFDADLSITATNSKTFHQNSLDFNVLKTTKGIQQFSRAIDEIVVVKHEQKWVNARMIGVDSSFLEIAKVKKHLVDGKAILNNNEDNFSIFGATLLDKLGGFIPKRDGFETVILYVPKRDTKMRLGTNPFRTELIKVAGRVNYNREVNADHLIVPLQLAADLLNYDKDLSAIYVDLKDGADKNQVKESLIKSLGNTFTIKTNYEKNELIYKTSQTEKMMVIVILVFIFILAAFNLVSSITMLYIEKKENLGTLKAMGANEKNIFNIFFFEGLLISFKGIFIGFVIGYLICTVQLLYPLLEMPNSGGQAFPIGIRIQDGLLIFFLVSLLSILFSYFPVKIIMKKHILN